MQSLVCRCSSTARCQTPAPRRRRAGVWLPAVLLASLAAPGVGLDDPITPDHPLWIAMRGTAVVDGSLADPDWQTAVPIVRAQPWRGDGTIAIRMLYSDSGLYLAVEVDDQNLWADGLGGGSGNRWEVETDDSVTFYFDPDASRDEFFQATDRAFGFNLANPEDPINGAGTVRRCKYIRGDGGFGAPDVVACAEPVGPFLATGILWRTTVSGTVNNGADSDTGWVSEVFLPWSAIGASVPAHGSTLAMNFDVIFDNDGGARNFVYNGEGPNRFVLPGFIDDHVQGAHSSFHDSLAGLRGPVGYAALMFVDPAAAAAPAAIGDLGVQALSSRGVHLSFTAPTGTTGGSGHVSSYAIRYSSIPITSEGVWDAATVFENAYVPRLAGQAEILRIAGLAPAAGYYVAVRARDAAGHLAALSNSPFLLTQAASGPGDRGRIIPAPNGSLLQFEDGTPFVPIGEHLGLSWTWYRILFPGDVWDPLLQIFQNYNLQEPGEGPVGPHLDELAAQGVNTLRIFLELLNTDQTGNVEIPRGRYWIEYPSGTFNLDMRQFVLNTLVEVAARDMYVILSPFDTFSWDDVFVEETPWYVGNGGPLTTIDDFFQNAQTLDLAKARLQQVMDWVAESPHADRVLGWEPLNEWDSPWTLNAEGNAEPGRETEMRRRAGWIRDLNAWVREQDPDRLVISSTASRDPRGPRARAVFYDRTVDVLGTHLYTNSNEEPINNPGTDKKVLPAIENAQLTSYWMTHRNDHRPVLNGEWGMTSIDWPGQSPQYGPGFTEAEDGELYRTVSWSALATGQVGSGLRIANDELFGNLQSLTPAMRDVQLTISRFLDSSSISLDLTHFEPHTLAGRISVSSVSGAELLAWGVADGVDGIAYVLQDGNVTSGTVSDGQLMVEGLPSGVPIHVEFWSTQGGASLPLQSLPPGMTSPQGGITLPLLAFEEDLAVKFAPAPGGLGVRLAALLLCACVARRRTR
jgi:hypothetical protein